VERHLLFGKGAPAEAWADGSDEADARMIDAARQMADSVIPGSDSEEILQRSSHATS
jgi:hypothetical protein